ncbi:serine/threonine-protein kinase [Actinomadura geliboluensis]|uniref:serine/threonine-protein kinase n=1 Tax=Actinomadura geliboluensis TaxID=882440 RepID=UPI003699977B
MQRVVPLEARDPRQVGGFQILGRLGVGGQGVVYQGRGRDGTLVAVKVLHEQLVASRANRNALARELEAARRVAPFCTAQVIAADLDAERPYVVSEYVDGASLEEVVESEGPRKGNALHRLSVATATALVAIHEAGIVHRDFKPANVLIGTDGPRVIDFGIARLFENTTTLTGKVVGTPTYMSPEQAAGERVGPATDVFAWGGVMTYAAVGRPPFGRGPMAAVMVRLAHEDPDLGDLPEPMRGLVMACLEKDPARRPTAHAVLMRLVAAPVSVQAPVEAPAPYPEPGPARNVTQSDPETQSVTLSPDTNPEPVPPVVAPDRLLIRRPSLGRKPSLWWSTLSAVAALLVVAGFLIVQHMRNGYYVGEEDGKVVLYRGTKDTVLGLSLSRKAASKEQLNPPIVVADLPGSVQGQVKETFAVQGPEALHDLAKRVCKYGLGEDEGRVVIVKGRGQAECRQTMVVASDIRVSELPRSDAAKVTAGEFAFVGRAAADAALSRLANRRDACKESGGPAIADCPSAAS